MENVTLGSRPTELPPRTKISDFSDGDLFVRVSMKLIEAQDDRIVIDAQAFQVDATGALQAGPDGRPSRTRGTQHVIAVSSLGDTHTLNPGWVRIIGDYNAENFEPSAPRGTGKPTEAPDASMQYFDETTGIGYRYDDGEIARIARGKVEELAAIVRNSAPIAGIDF